MQLPGGVWREESLRRDFAFGQINGHLELALAETSGVCPDLPGQVSCALHAALAQLGGQKPNLSQIDDLSVGDRQFLMSRLACHLGLGEVWLSAECGHCQSHFDFPVDYCAIPVKQAGAGYPFAELELSMGRARLRVPTGTDQRAVLGYGDDQEARHALVLRCLEPSRHAAPLTSVSEEDVAKVDQVLEAMAPELATQASAHCPECEGANVLAIDPYACLGRVSSNLFVEIHQLAVHYHWSEAEILGLPRWRRKKYLSLIDRARGMSN